MAPTIKLIRFQNRVYSVEILNYEMEKINNQINDCDHITQSLNAQLLENQNLVNKLNNDLAILYIQQTGRFPS